MTAFWFGLTAGASLVFFVLGYRYGREATP